MVLLSGCPIYPPESELERLQAVFLTSFKQHIFIDAVDVVDSAICALPPYLQLAIACMSSATSFKTDTSPYAQAVGTNQAEVSAGLFVAGVSLWSVMLEVDNREARLLEAVVAVSETALYMSGDPLSDILGPGIIFSHLWTAISELGLLAESFDHPL